MVKGFKPILPVSQYGHAEHFYITMMKFVRRTDFLLTAFKVRKYEQKSAYHGKSVRTKEFSNYKKIRAFFKIAHGDKKKSSGFY